MDREQIISRNNVKVAGSGEQVLLFAHGFGCNQKMWRFLLPELQNVYTIVSFDYVGSATTSLAAFSKPKYSSLEGYAQDIIDVCEALDLHNVTIVGHSVSGIISLLAATQIPDRIAGLVMICPSPCYLNVPPDYSGGFETEDLKELMDLMDKNYIGWADFLIPLVTGDTETGDTEETERHNLSAELSESFCSTNPMTAKAFAEATFFSDYRSLLPRNQHPVLLLQSENDSLAPLYIGEYMHEHMPQSVLHIVNASGHCLHMTHPKEAASAIEKFMFTLTLR